MKRQIHFGVVHPDGSISTERVLMHEVIERCPNYMLVAEHYPEDGGPCACFDREATELASYGYVWDEAAGRWS